MSLRSELVADITEAFDEDLEDAVREIAYTSIGTTSGNDYSPSTGQIVDASARTAAPRAVVSLVSIDTAQPLASQFDVLATLIADELESAFVPKTGDIFMDKLVGKVTVIGVIFDALGAVYTLRGRRER